MLMSRTRIYRDLLDFGDFQKGRKYWMDQARIKGFLQKNKDNPLFVNVYTEISENFGGKFPCCKPLERKHCNLFYSLVWKNEEAKKAVSKEFAGNVIEYVADDKIKRYIVL